MVTSNISARRAASRILQLGDMKKILYQWRVFPRTTTTASPRNNYGPVLNDDVYIRPKSVKEIGFTGSITAINNSYTSSSKYDSRNHTKKRKLTEDVRVTIQQHCYHHWREKHDGCVTCQAMKHDVRPSRLVQVFDLKTKNNSTDTLVILTPDTTTYRHLATAHLRPNDHVLEIGCSSGECTALMLRRILLLHSQKSRQAQHKNQQHDFTSIKGGIVAFDTGSKILQQAENRLRKEYQQLTATGTNNDDNDHVYSKLIQLHKVDALADPKGAYSYATENKILPGMVLIDIGGNRELDSVVRMIDWVQTEFDGARPRVILVKSEALEMELSKSNLTSSNCTIVPCVAEDGQISNGQEWFNSLVTSYADVGIANRNLTRKQLLSMYSHPKKVPLVLSPKDSTPICRYHNYHPDGCKKFHKRKDLTETAEAEEDNVQCQYDHEHCHFCQQIGHVALDCPSLK